MMRSMDACIYVRVRASSPPTHALPEVAMTTMGIAIALAHAGRMVGSAVHSSGVGWRDAS